MPITDIELLLRHGILYKKLVTSVTKMLDHYRLSNDQISVFMLDFESRLTKYLQNALHPKPKTA